MHKIKKQNSLILSRNTMLIPEYEFTASVNTVYFTVFFFLIICFYFWLYWVFTAVHSLLIAVASLVVEHGL